MTPDRFRSLSIDELRRLLTKEHSTKLLNLLRVLINVIRSDDSLEKKYRRRKWFKKIPGRKKDREKIAAQLMADEKVRKAWFNSLSPDAVKVLNYITWKTDCRVDKLEKATGISILESRKVRSYHYSEPVIRKPFYFVEVEARWSYTPMHEHVSAWLPEYYQYMAVKTLPRPRNFYLHPHNKPVKAEFSANFEASVQLSLITALNFLQEGHLSLKKNGEPKVQGLKDMQRVAGIEEFYNVTKGELRFLRTGIMIKLLQHHLEYENTRKQAQEILPHDMLKEIFTLWVISDFQIFEYFLTHLKDKNWYYHPDPDINVKPILFELLSGLEDGKHYEFQELSEYVWLRLSTLEEKSYEVFELTDVYHEDEHGQSYTDRIHRWEIYELISEPTLKAFLFIAASFGLVELYYDMPENSLYRKYRKNYLTLFDGAKGVRITELGAYVTGATSKYENAACQKIGAEVTFDNERLIATVSGNDPVLELTLEKLMDKMGRGRYRLTFDSLFRTCKNSRDIKAKKKLLAGLAKLPPSWNDFFKRAESRLNPLKKERNTEVFRLADDPELLHIIASDPVISNLSLKVEGRRIAVKRQDIPALAKQLKRYGYAF